MNAWVDVRKRLPGLRGLRVHVLPASARDALERALRDAGFDLRTLEGARVNDAASFQAEAARALALPSYCGTSWDALDEGLLELDERPSRHLAILWTEADRCLGADLQAFLDAVQVFEGAAAALAQVAREDGPGPLQLQVFVLGGGPAFAMR